ncbi:hypothetical protein FLL45_13055 [Aliikangiella marina]|uniref:Lipoprotein n=1 Tax=Aliikangiella marina TaxID=1712262 RepID=A0A545T9A4_9GAMM|nr:hypothetical protein [Aliikangiella marina]TQV73792.1 hypothetical protein FLL45_13055 [Aliikangiella marina]
MIDNYLKRKPILLYLSTFLLVIALTACHPPVKNYLTLAEHTSLRWQNVPLNDLISIKGQPSSIHYLGNSVVSDITSEFWISEVDQYVTLYRGLLPEISASRRTEMPERFYSQSTRQGAWLLVYRTPVRAYRAHNRYCVEYYVIDTYARVLESGVNATAIDDYKHCLLDRNS